MFPASRRSFFGSLSGLAGVLLTPSISTQAEEQFHDGPRRREALRLRIEIAEAESETVIPSQETNGDSERYDSHLANYSKGLNHNQQGSVNPADYQLLLKALATGKWADLEDVPMGGKAKLSDPLAAFAYSLEGCDSHRTWTPPPPSFASDEQAAELIELYWQALTRDISFSEYDSSGLIEQACADLTKFGPPSAVLSGGAVTPDTIFRANFPGCLTGPYVSQFLWLDIPVDNLITSQQYPCLAAGSDRMTSYADFLDVENGSTPVLTSPLTAPRYVLCARDLAAYVHRDFACQGYQNAALILSSFGSAAWSDGNPYKQSKTQAPFVCFGLPGFVDWVGRAAHAALNAAWYHKWLVHRRIRPEEFAGRVQNRIVWKAPFPISERLFRSSALNEVYAKQGSYLLAQAYDEGCPLHPSYPAAHATIGGACVTILKALFDENFAFPKPVIPTASGDALEPYYAADPLTVGDELNKLAANLAIGRNAAGVHWRSDSMQGLLLGERVAVHLLRDLLSISEDNQLPLTFHNFAGQSVTIRPTVQDTL